MSPNPRYDLDGIDREDYLETIVQSAYYSAQVAGAIVASETGKVDVYVDDVLAGTVTVIDGEIREA